MENKEISWGEVKITLGGKEINTFASIDLAAPGSDISTESNIISRYGALTVASTISFSRKNFKELKRMFKSLKACKKQRLPRKLKKRLKKEHQHVTTWFNNQYLPHPSDLCKYLRCRCYAEPVISPIPNNILKGLQLIDIDKIIGSFNPRDFRPRPRCIIAED